MGAQEDSPSAGRALLSFLALSILIFQSQMLLVSATGRVVPELRYSWLVDDAEALNSETITPEGAQLITRFLAEQDFGQLNTNSGTDAQKQALPKGPDQQQFPFPIPPELIALILGQGGSLAEAIPLVINMVRARIQVFLAGQLLGYSKHICANGQLQTLSRQLPGILRTLLMRALGVKLTGVKELNDVQDFLEKCLEDQRSTARAQTAMKRATLFLSRSSNIVKGQITPDPNPSPDSPPSEPSTQPPSPEKKKRRKRKGPKRPKKHRRHKKSPPPSAQGSLSHLPPGKH